MKSGGIDESPRAVLRRLAEEGNKLAPANKPLVSAANVPKRKDCALRHDAWTPLQWRRVYFADDSSVGLNACRPLRLPAQGGA